MDANKRAMTSLHDSLYRMQLQSGYPQEVAHQVPAPEAYQTYCAWPGDRPFVYGGGGGSSSHMQVDEQADESQGGDDDDAEEVASANSTEGTPSRSF